MPDKVILTITAGNLTGHTFEFDTRTTCIIGRAKDCQLALPDDENHRTISRYHCLLDINPPVVRVRDFGSLNGTYVNGQKIGQRQRHQTPEEAAQQKFPEYDLNEGDEIKLSHTVFKVSLKIDPETLKTLDILKAKIYAPTLPSKKPNLLEFIKNLIIRADSGESSLLAIQGYSIIRKIGEGGWGAVYLAKHNKTGEMVALKVMLPQVIATEHAVDKFLREAANTKALNHPNIVKLKEFGYSDDTFFFTLDYCNLGSVHDFMQNQGQPLPIDQALRITLQVLDGLIYAHNAKIPYVKLADGSFGQGQGLVHRDIKPSNIFLTHTDNKFVAKIGDYGLSKAFDLAGLSGLSMSGNTAGTPAFMPRQQVLDFKYAKPEVDVWATAASLYFMLTGTIPRNLSGQDPFLAVLQNNPIPIRQQNSSIPKALAKVIDLALIDNPDILFKNAADFKQALLDVSK